MIDYEYLYSTTGVKCTESVFLPLCGKNVQSLFSIHQRVIDQLVNEGLAPLIKLLPTLTRVGYDEFRAIKIRLKLPSQIKKGQDKSLMGCDFEKLLTKGFRQMNAEQDALFEISEADCLVSAYCDVFNLTNYLPKNDFIISQNELFPEQTQISNRPTNLTRANEECDSSPPMQERTRKKVAIQAAIPPDSSVFQDLRLSPLEDKEALRLRDHLSKVIRRFSDLEGNSVEDQKLLSFATDLNSTFIEYVDHQLRPKIEPIERSINERLSNFEPSTLPQKQEFAKAVNAELRSLGLAIRCPKTNRPSILVADPSSHPSNGRFQLQHKGIDDKPKRSFSTVNLKNVTLMPDISSFDIDLASILSKLPIQRILTSATN